ncbi:MAG TPA: hypothetical protein EYQ53_02695 [Candidatus Poseidoniales archaeon]|nr:hypothetical protein [Candidatus Poseidoniales archaeon]HIK78804.1 hypothetical protein [Candidatus Poseidoniales archaeon]
MATHPNAQPNFRNMFWKPFHMCIKAMARTFSRGPLNRWAKANADGYHNKIEPNMLDEKSIARAEGNIMNDVTAHEYTADREGSELFPTIWKPYTIMYPYERLEDLEPWLFEPGQYNGRIGVVWETCTACKLCIRICPNDCLHMSTKLRVDILDLQDEDSEHGGLGSNLQVGGYAALPLEEVIAAHEVRNPVTAHTAPEPEYRFGEVISLSGKTATVRWNDSNKETIEYSENLLRGDEQIVSGMIDMGRCMFCGLCMEACDSTSFFMTNEYDGLSGYTREDLWYDASRTRVLISEQQEAVDEELALRAKKERAKRAKKADKKSREAKKAEA